MTNQTDDAPSASPSTIRRHAFVFPGQGSQYVGMGADLVERTPAAAAVLERADAALGFPLSSLILDGPAEDLDRTVNAQDLNLFRTVFGASTTGQGSLAGFDFDGDGVVNGADLNFFRQHYGASLLP